MGEQCILGNLGNNGCHCSYFFPISKKGFFMFYNIQTLCDTVCIFSLHLMNFKGVIGVPVVMAPIFVSFASKIKNCDVIISSFATSSTHIYPIGNL